MAHFIAGSTKNQWIKYFQVSYKRHIYALYGIARWINEQKLFLGDHLIKQGQSYWNEIYKNCKLIEHFILS